ncbi:hydantoinase B/oxoprolinase family protein, partial [Candidatus Bathyarchaeota archaeon]|nr:hydantoinase B/oxoprolinase family protein [Candidatus Bathyarchaeota archaeon]
MEAYLPLRFQRYSLRPNTGGPGEWRGGCGIERSWTLTGTGATLSILAERVKIPPWGLRGGGSGALGEYILERADGSSERLPSKCTIPLRRGDTLHIRTPGGGGYGDPYARRPELVLRDVRNGLVGVESAEEDYGVIIDAESLEVLVSETEEYRGSRK